MPNPFNAMLIPYPQIPSGWLIHFVSMYLIMQGGDRLSLLYHRSFKWASTLSNNFECQSFTYLVWKYVTRCDICQSTKYLQWGPTGYATPLSLPVRLWSDIRIDFYNLSTLFSKCFLLCHKIPAAGVHIVCISWHWRIVNSQSEFQFSMPYLIILVLRNIRQLSILM